MGKKVKNHPKRQKAYKPKPSSTRVESMPKMDMTDTEYAFWLAHGLNCLLSDYDEGLWTPLLEVYDGKGCLTPGEIRAKVFAHFGFPGREQEVSNREKVVLAWTVQGKEVVWAYRFEAHHRIQQASPDGDAPTLAKSPANGTVWRMFHDLVFGQVLHTRQ